MEWSEVRRLVRLVEKSEIQELELEREGTRIRISKPAPVFTGTQQIAIPQPAQIPMPTAAPEPGQAASPGAPAAAEQAEKKGNYHEVKSPMVGTFYRAPAPDADPYVQVGDMVSHGQTLCIVEAMKLMNEIESDVAGRVVEIVCQNEEPVEFGQVLFLIDPKG